MTRVLISHAASEDTLVEELVDLLHVGIASAFSPMNRLLVTDVDEHPNRGDLHQLHQDAGLLLPSSEVGCFNVAFQDSRFFRVETFIGPACGKWLIS